MSTQSLKETGKRSKIWWILGLATLGVMIRLVFLLLAGDLEPYSDESNYLYLSAIWDHFSIYSDGAFFLWPPGYPFFLMTMIRHFGVEGVFIAKLCQVLLSGIVGWMCMLLAGRLFRFSTVCLTGLIWSVYLPLIGFTHYLWPETLFLSLSLPGLYLLVCWWQQEPRASAGNGRLVAAGLLIGLSLLVKEVGLWWCALLCALILYRDWKSKWSVALARATLFVLTVAVIIVPWTLRNYEVYGRFAPVGATLGQNFFLCMNARYTNFDYPRFKVNQIARSNPEVRRWLTKPDSRPWRRSYAINVIDRSSMDVKRGLQYALANPGFILRSRIKKVADWATPLSFFIRHYGLDRYHGFLTVPSVRGFLIVWALLLPMLVLAGAIGGACLCLRGNSVRPLILWSLLYFFASGALIAGMSRYRICMEPLLIILSAAFLTGAGRPWKKSTASMLCPTIGWILLFVFWGLNAAEILETVKIAW